MIHWELGANYSQQDLTTDPGGVKDVSHHHRTFVAELWDFMTVCANLMRILFDEAEDAHVAKPVGHTGIP